MTTIIWKTCSTWICLLLITTYLVHSRRLIEKSLLEDPCYPLPKYYDDDYVPCTSWYETNSPNTQVLDFSIGANDGKYIVLLGSPGSYNVFFSNNSGNNFYESTLDKEQEVNGYYVFYFTATASGSTGQNVTLIGNNNYVGISHDYGAHFAVSNVYPATAATLTAIAMSADTQNVFIGTDTTSLFLSKDFGTVYSAVVRSEFNYIQAVACSSNGEYVITVTSTYMSISSNYGTDWVTVNSDVSMSWMGVAVSANGQFMYAVGLSEALVYLSTDYGQTWFPSQSLPVTGGNGLYDVSCDSSGQFIVVATWNFIYQSADFGVNWYLSLGIVEPMEPYYYSYPYYQFEKTASTSNGSLVFVSGIFLYAKSVNTTQSESTPTISSTLHPTPLHTRAPSTFAPSSVMPADEVDALITFYYATGGPDWFTDDSEYQPYYYQSYDATGVVWDVDNPSASPCLDNWYGVICTSVDSTYHVTTLYLKEHNLVGSIPDIFGNLTYLEELKLMDNFLWGTLPTSLFNLTDFALIDLQNNSLSGSIPFELINMPSLYTVYLNSNQFNGTLPTGFDSVLYFQGFRVDDNSLTGTFPIDFAGFEYQLGLNCSLNNFEGQLPNFTNSYGAEIDFSYNQLTGTLPLGFVTNVYMNDNFLTGWLNAFVGEENIDVFTINLSSNLLTGSIPSALGLNIRQQFLILSNNMLSGSLPAAALETMVELRLLDLSNNNFTSPLPNNLTCYSGQGTCLIELYGNHFTGTIPLDFLLGLSTYPSLFYINVSGNELSALPEIGDSTLSVSSLFSLDVSNNNLDPINWEGYGDVFTSLNFLYLDSAAQTGTLPVDLLGMPVAVLSLQDNYYFGTIPTAFVQHSEFTLLYLNNNLLSGSLPDMTGLFRLITLYLNDNLFSGSLDSSMQKMSSLESLLLYNNRLVGGLDIFNATLQTNLLNVDVSNNAFSGTLPAEIFKIPSLSTFAAVSNCLDGPMPTEVCSSQSLTVLVLDGMHTASQCRRKYLQSFDAYKQFTALSGGVPECLFEMPQLQTLHLSGTGLTGTVPNMSPIGLVDLSLSHNSLTGPLPKLLTNRNWTSFDLSYNGIRDTLIDHFSSNYNSSSGTVTLNVNHLSGKLPSVIVNAHNVNVLQGNLFQCDGSRELPSNDPNEKNYSCASDSFDDAVYTWIAMISVIGALITLLAWKYWSRIVKIRALLVKAEVCLDCPHVVLATEVFRVVRHFCFWFTITVVMILLPVYCGLTVLYGTYNNEYAWEAAGIYLSGTLPGVVLLILYLLLLTGCCGLWWKAFQPLISRETAIPHSKSKDPKQMKWFLLLNLLKVAILLSDAAVMIGLNVGYVVVSMNFSSTIVHITQVAVAALKLLWNRGVVYKLLQTAFSEGTTLSSLEVVLLIFNNVIAPFIAIAFANVNCFYNFFFPASAVSSVYSYLRCAKYSFIVDDSTGLIIGANCAIYEEATRSTSFIPPFVYSYQCSSAFIATYSNVYIFMFLLLMLGSPVMDVVLTCLVKQWEWKIPQWVAFTDLSVLIVKEQDEVKSNTPNDDKVKLVRQGSKTLRASTLIGQMCSVLALLWSIGVLVPLLSIIGCVTLASVTLYQQLCIGLFAADEKALNAFNESCESIVRRLQNAVWLVFPYLGLFYFLALVDIFQNFVNPLVVGSALFAVWLGWEVWLRCRPANFVQSIVDPESEGKVAAEVEMNNVA